MPPPAAPNGPPPGPGRDHATAGPGDLRAVRAAETVRYHSRGGTEVPDYECIRDCIDNAGHRCETIPGAAADTAIGQLLLDTLTPLTLEVALTVQAEIETRAADAMRASHVERARHRADLARRRHLAVDPGLVATTLEADWNQALRALQAAGTTTTTPPPLPRSPSTQVVIKYRNYGCQAPQASHASVRRM